uniref:Uncharacterized protein n=1 Tax=Arcella intermedia TaxID=1963864 RepID=A0A6B2L0H1_9EUKA
MARNQSLKDMLSHRGASRKRNTALLPEKAVGVPYFKDAKESTPPLNPDAQRKRIRRQMLRLPETFEFKPWPKKENKALVAGVRQQNQQLRLKALYEKFNSTEADSAPVELFNQEMENIRSMSDEEFEKDVEGIDWQTLADTCLPGHSGEACKVHWMNQCNPAINNASWTREEDKRLLEIATQEGGYDWSKITEQLGTNRRPYQCLMRYQRSLNKDILRSEWTEQETELLLLAVATFGKKNWQQVANCLNGRTGQQCLHRWRDTSNPLIKRGNWTNEEDRRLTLAVKAYATKKWVKIQTHVPRRTDVQCRERWMNILNPDLTCEDWTPEEDVKLQRAISQHGVGKWALVAKDLYPRTDNQCWRRWKSKNVKAVLEYNKKRKRKSQMVRNFAGRAKERSTLTLDDITLEDEEERKRKRRKIMSTIPVFSIPKLTMAFPSQRANTEINASETPAVPVVVPSPVTYRVLGNLLADIGLFPVETNSVISEDALYSKEFQILSSWFSAVLLYPTLIFSHLNFIAQHDMSQIAARMNEMQTLEGLKTENDTSNPNPNGKKIKKGAEDDEDEELDLFE